MNYLAHSYLSYSQGQLVGQFLQDFIRNKDRYSFEKEIRIGIELHRCIDLYTDTHPLIREAKGVFAPLVGKYSGAFSDVSMDYFLALDSSIYTPMQWEQHALYVVNTLQENAYLFPESFKLFLTKMQEYNYLMYYGTETGIEKSFLNVLKKAKYLSDNLPVYDVFCKEKELLKSIYEEFFPNLEVFTRNKSEELNKIIN